ncbi:7-carboxy-7-deazaguanine synthase QueE [Ferrimonas sp. SCSIO 43195]|uniref:7-carboxy-7-deazaguanine synthase QueE n=1 Tax=Ferrimonas sp. SCSIO 43195 TaxID=2822844 RepID=UPI002075C834|nr:7-carboxy-7-deazaguanine synthase QueE [Ferrimonas sp. SCSIO 43195]USD38757.1 7-carboxy-7-deazaguanine synthase QueE [Ferrimonas sp. SCSIO 43195]
MSLPVNELFETIQGEGQFTGVPAVFVRLQGCPVGCPWCDTRHTWELKDADEVAREGVIGISGDAPRWASYEVAQLVALLTDGRFQARHLVITGGEPCLYDLRALTEQMHQAGWRCQIETSGCAEVKVDDHTWVTVSPKINMKGGLPVLTSALQRADEIKHPVALEKHIEELDQLLQGVALPRQPQICLQPISTQKRATEMAIRVCIERNWRLSVQTHKYLNID